MDMIFDPSYLQRRTAVLAQHGRKVRMQLVTNLGNQNPFAILRAENQMYQDTGQGLRHSRSPFRTSHALNITRSRDKFYLEGKIARPFRPRRMRTPIQRPRAMPWAKEG